MRIGRLPQLTIAYVMPAAAMTSRTSRVVPLLQLTRNLPSHLARMAAWQLEYGSDAAGWRRR